MATDKTNNLTAFLTNTADAIRTAEGSTAAINPQDFEAKITALKLSTQTADANAAAGDILLDKTAYVDGVKVTGTMPTPERGTTSITVAADDTNDKLTITASNTQPKGYNTDTAAKTATTTVTLTASGKTVTATATDGTKISKNVSTASRASTTIATTANDTADTLTVTASNNQGTGYVTGSNKTASKIVTLSVAQPTIDASGNVTAVATAADNSSTPVSISKTSETLALGAKTSDDLSVSGAKVSVPAGYYPSNAEKSVATATRANTSISVTADDTADTLKIDASNNQSTGYVTGANKTATTTVTLTASGATVTATETGGKKVSKSVATASRAGTTLTSTKNTTNNTLDFTAANNQSTGYVTGSNSTATKSVSLSASGATVTASDGTNSISKSVSTVGRANTTLTSSKNTTNNTLDFTASNNQGTGYVTGANKTATKTVSLSTSGATVTASDGTNSISTSVATGAYSASATATAGASVEASGSGITLGTATGTEPTSGKYITVTGTGSATASGTASVGTTGYISAGSKSASDTDSASATLYYPISSNIVDTSDGNASASQILSGKVAYVDGEKITGSMTNRGAVTKVLDTSTTSYAISSGYHNGSGKVSISLEEKTATPTAAAQTITPSSGKVLSKVTVAAVPTQTKSATPTTSAQTVSPDSGKFLSSVTVNAIPSSYVNVTNITKDSDDLTTDKATVNVPAGYYPDGASKSIANVSGSIGGTASNGSATAAINNVNSMNTITDLTNKTAGTDYFTVTAKATGTAGGYTPKYTVSTGGYIGSTVTGTKQTVSVTSDTTGKSIHIPKAAVSVGGSASSGKATAAISNVNSMRTISSASGTAGTDYFTVKATATGTAGSYTPSMSVSTAGYLKDGVTSSAKTVSVSSDSTGKSIMIPKATFTRSGASIKTTSTGGGYVKDNTTVGTIPDAVLSTSGSATANFSATPGTVSIANKTASVSGKTQLTASPSTSTSGISTYYMAVNATAASNSASGSIGGIASTTVSSAGYVKDSTSGSIDGTATVEIQGKTSDTYYLPIASGSCSVSGGGLTSSSGAVSATGTNVTLTELSAAPSSGAYITVTGSGSVSRAAITKTQSAGYISSGTSTASSATSKSSNTATKYYAIATNDDIYLYGVYQFISTPTGSGLSYNWSQIVSEPITFGWTGTTSGSPGTVYENICSTMKVQYGSYGLAIWYGSDVAYTNTTYGGISSYTGWQAIDGVGSTTTRTIIIATPYRISSSSAFYRWFSNNTEKIDDWNGGTGGGGGSNTPDITTSTVTISRYGSEPYGYSGNTDFYYTAYENGTIVAKHVSSNVANNVTLNNVVINTYLTYNCVGGVAISPSTGASWVDDIRFTGSQMAMIFEITGTSASFSSYTDCCFEGTSQVLMADGTTKNLSEISIGEQLMTYNEQTGVNEINEVTALGTADVNHNTIIVLEDDTIIQMNKYHPMWTEDGWKSIVGHRNLPKLTEADKLMNNNGDYIAIKSIEEVEIDTTTYYTIKVANNNNFYVNGYLAQGKEKD